MSIVYLAWGLLFLAIFWSVLYLISRRRDLKKRNIEVGPGWLMWRTKRGLEFIDRTASAHKRGWAAFGTTAAIVGFAIMIFMFVSLLLNAFFIVTRPEVAPAGVRLVIPGITIPLWQGLVAIVSVMVVHEFAHGFLLRAQGLPVKSMGAMAFLVIPGAFVEPVRERLEKAPVKQRLRMYGAGSLSNILLAMLCLSILLVVVAPREGVYVWKAPDNENAPAYGKLWPGMRLYSISINDNAATKLNKWGDFYDIMDNVRLGDNLTIVRGDNNDNITLTAVSHPENENRGYLGGVATISAIPRSNFINPLFTIVAISYGILGYDLFHPYCNDSYLPWPIVSLLMWMFLLNFAIGLFNLLPAVPLDGGYIFHGLVESRTSPKVARRATKVISCIVLVLIIVGFLPVLR